MKCQFLLTVPERPRDLRECGAPAEWERRTSAPGVSPRRNYCGFHMEQLCEDGFVYAWRELHQAKAA